MSSVKVLTEYKHLRSISVPKPRSGHRIVCDYVGHVYSIGGYNPSIDSDEEGLDDDWRESRPLFKELWKYSPTTKTWMRIRTTGEIPKHLASHSAVFIGGSLIVYGGTGVPFGHTSSNIVYCCDLETYTWKSIEPANPSNDVNIPPQGYGQGIVVDPIDECVYVSLFSWVIVFLTGILRRLLVVQMVLFILLISTNSASKLGRGPNYTGNVILAIIPKIVIDTKLFCTGTFFLYLVVEHHQTVLVSKKFLYLIWRLVIGALKKQPEMVILLQIFL